MCRWQLGNTRQSVEDFLNFVDSNGAPVNYMLFTGHNFYRNKLGIDRYREATKEEIAKIINFIKRHRKHGVVGYPLVLNILQVYPLKKL